MNSGKPSVLQLGTSWTGLNEAAVERFKAAFNVIQLPKEELERNSFIASLKSGKWGNFDAIIRPIVASGAETEPWNDEIVSALPKSLKVYASVGAGYEWMDIPLLTQRGELVLLSIEKSCSSSTNTR